MFIKTCTLSGCENTLNNLMKQKKLSFPEPMQSELATSLFQTFCNNCLGFRRAKSLSNLLYKQTVSNHR